LLQILFQAVLAVPPYFHSSRVSLATATAVSGASIGMLGIPFLLQYLLDKYGLRGATLLGSCLWLSVGLAGALFGKGVINIDEEESTEIIVDQSVVAKTDHEREYPTVTPYQSNGLIYSRRTSLLPTSAHYHHQQKHARLSSLYQQYHNSDKLMVNTLTNYEGSTSYPRDKSRRYAQIVYKSQLIIQK
jgi:hypothetical protein